MERILVLDDEPRMLRAIERKLRSLALADEAQFFSNAAEAMAELALGPWAVLLVDYRMPQMDGIRFLELATRVAPLSARLLMSGYQDRGMLVDAINRGCALRFLQKGWTDNALREALSAGLDAYRSNLAKHALDQQSAGHLQQQEQRLAWKVHMSKMGFDAG